MKRKDPASWVVDYSAARASAIQWLGDRYLLAKPINASRYASHLSAPAAAPPAESPDPFVAAESH